MTNIAPIRFASVAFAALLVAGVVTSCSESNFAGDSKSNKGFGLGSGGGNDGDETDCDPKTDPDCLSTGTGTGTDPGPDSDGDGIPDALEPGDSNGDGIPDAQQPLVIGNSEGKPDSNNDGVPDDPGLGEGDGNQANSLLEDGTVTYTDHDNDHRLILQRLKTAMPDGTAITLEVNDDTNSFTLPKACFTYKPTCFQITVSEKVEQRLGRDSCIAVESQDMNSMTINADADGVTLIGSCIAPHSDERFTISCPHGLDVQGCAG